MDTFLQALLIVCHQQRYSPRISGATKMKTLILTQKLCWQCKQELNFFKRLRGELYCDDHCRQQRSKEAVARARQDYTEIPALP
jgi:hypothetical protein